MKLTVKWPSIIAQRRKSGWKKCTTHLSTEVVMSRKAFSSMISLKKQKDIIISVSAYRNPVTFNIVLYCIQVLYSATQQPNRGANRGALGSISSKKRDKF